MQQFLRKPRVLQTTGLSNTELHEKIKDGTFPGPDGHLGPRSPFWTEETISNWQRSVIEHSRSFQPSESPKLRAGREAAQARRARKSKAGDAISDAR